MQLIPLLTRHMTGAMTVCRTVPLINLTANRPLHLRLCAFYALGSPTRLRGLAPLCAMLLRAYLKKKPTEVKVRREFVIRCFFPRCACVHALPCCTSTTHFCAKSATEHSALRLQLTHDRQNGLIIMQVTSAEGPLGV